MLALQEPLTDSAIPLQVIFVDGGSKDGSQVLAAEAGFTVVPNPHGDLVHAKWIGLHRASSRWVCFMDHDERLTSPSSLRDRIEVMNRDKRIKIVLPSGYDLSESSGLNQYYSEFGDPFSYFFYRSPNRHGYRLQALEKRLLTLRKEPSFVVFGPPRGEKQVLCEPVAAAGLVDGHFFSSLMENSNLGPMAITQLYYLMLEASPDNWLAVMRNDAVEHNSVETFRHLRKKIHWRAINAGGQTSLSAAGVMGRLRIQQRVSEEPYVRRLLAPAPWHFVVYTFTLIPVLVDALRLAWSRKRLAYLVHVPLSFDVCRWVLWARLRRWSGIGNAPRRYGS